MDLKAGMVVKLSEAFISNEGCPCILCCHARGEPGYEKLTVLTLEYGEWVRLHIPNTSILASAIAKASEVIPFRTPNKDR